MSSETKEKILEAANKLFSKYGFDGASIRDIAKEAGVNLGAINYHFENKENLYLELIMEMRKFVDDDMKKLSSSRDYNLKDFTVALYEKFMEYGDALNNSFKLFLNDSVSTEAFERYNFERCFTPPGLDALLDVISKEYGDKISPFGKIWIGKSIFTIVTHSVLMQNSSIGKYHMMTFPQHSVQKHMHTICEMAVEANVEYVLKNPHKFEQFCCEAEKNTGK